MINAQQLKQELKDLETCLELLRKHREDDDELVMQVLDELARVESFIDDIQNENQ